MQTQTQKKEESARSRREGGPVRIMDPSRLSGANLEAFREAQYGFQRAHQELYNLTHGGGFGGAWPYPTAPSQLAAVPGAPGGAYLLATARQGSFSPYGATAPFPGAAYAPFATTQVPMLGNPWESTYAPNLASAFAFGNGPTRVPPCDIVDEGGEFVCQIELPGVKPENVELYCWGGTVQVNAQAEPDIDVGALVQSERGTVIQHRRVVTLPSEIQPNSCRATLRDGVLTLNLPKASPTEAPRRIDVGS